MSVSILVPIYPYQQYQLLVNAFENNQYEYTTVILMFVIFAIIFVKLL